MCLKHVRDAYRKSYGDQLNFVRKFPQLSQTFGESKFGFSSFQKVSLKKCTWKTAVATLISINLTPKNNHSCHKKNGIYTMFSRHIPFPHPIPMSMSPIKITISPSHGSGTHRPWDPQRTAASAPAHEDLKIGQVFCWMFQEDSTWLVNGL